MTYKILGWGVLAATVVVSGCGPIPGTVIQLDADKIQVIGKGSTEANALESAITAANQKCAELGKEAYVLSTDTKYYGVDKNTALIVDALIKATDSDAAAVGYSASTSTSPQWDDWRANLEVRCGPEPS